MSNYDRLIKLSTTELSDALDALGVEGALLNIKPLKPGYKLIGPAYTVRYKAYDARPKDFKPAGNYIDKVPKGAVVVIDNQGRADCTVWGGLLTQFASINSIAGTIIYGMARDVALICDSNYPVFSCGAYMRSGKNRVFMAEEQTKITIQDVTIHPGDMMVGDDNGVLVIPVGLIDEVLCKAEVVHQTEQLIACGIEGGVKLETLRRVHGYHQPWEK
jgi:regulator of RNase E activity RraA